MLNLMTPNDLPVRVPETHAEDVSEKFSLTTLESARAYYDTNGYVVIKSVLSPAVCDSARELWSDEIKTTDKHIYRQATAKAEKNTFNENGWVMNPILNLQSVDPRYFGKFRDHCTNSILTSKNTNKLLSFFLDDKPKIVQSMYFEGNSATWEHQDTYYLDSENMGTMVAAWIALEDIEADAGRFFVCPTSHKIEMDKQSSLNNVTTKHDSYISDIVDHIKDGNFEIRAPKLDKGDVLLWNSRTIHGSLKSFSKSKSRSSITCHVIPNRDKFLQFQSRASDLKCDEVNDVSVWRPKDQLVLKNRIILFVESRFPTLFYWLKGKAIQALVSKNN